MPNAIIFGYGGIGQALSHTLVSEGYQVMVVSRKPLHNTATIRYEKLDTCSEKSSSQLIVLISSYQPQLIINTIGMLHNTDCQPEKRVSQFDKECFTQSMAINFFPTVNIVKALDQALKRSDQLKFLVLSARVSSMGDNKLGGWYSYRISKAALNMFVKNTSIEWQRNFPKCAIFGYHPGTVDTPLSQPYQSRVSPKKLFSPQDACDKLMHVLDQLTINDSGYLFDWKGNKIEF